MHIKDCYHINISNLFLDTVRFAEDWGEQDKTALCHWLQEKEQKRQIETARRRLNDNQKNLSVKTYSSPQHLYSLLEKRLNNLPQQRASAAQWRATI
ncbi:MAG TPA: hypothetical protein EYP23_00565, partial [Thermoplasmata archaeon]|nr:hypothetical protein [Thermoplasmata archaeon]